MVSFHFSLTAWYAVVVTKFVCKVCECWFLPVKVCFIALVIPNLCSFSACLVHRSFHMDCWKEYTADLIMLVAMAVEWWRIPEVRRRAKIYEGIYPAASDAIGDGRIELWIAEGCAKIQLKFKFELILSLRIRLLVALTTLLMIGDQSIDEHLSKWSSVSSWFSQKW